MTADLLINGAGSKTGAAANARQRLPGYCASQHARTSVVEQDDVHLIRSFIFRTAFGSGNQGLIARQMLTRTRARQQLQEDFQIGEAWNDLLDRKSVV